MEKKLFMEKNVKLSGVTFGDCQENIKNYACPVELGIDEYDLHREPDNPHDKNAIWVGFGPFMLGYLPASLAQEISPRLKAGQNLVAVFVSLNQHPHHETIGLTVRITEKIQ